MTSLLTVRDWHVRFDTAAGEVEAVNGVGFTMEKGRTLGVVGGSGSGKSQLFLSLFGLLARNGRSTGTVHFDGTLMDRPAQMLGRQVAFVFQDPLTALTPHLTIGHQMAEALVHHLGLGWREAEARCRALLDQCRIPESARRMGQYPHELSGGMRQRVMIAQALSTGPKLLIADEPTTALDVTVQAQVLTLLQDLQAELGISIAFISHDMGVMAAIADDMLVMHAGRIIEQNRAVEIFAHPQHAQTRALIEARQLPPVQRSRPAPAEPLLCVRNASVQFSVSDGLFGRKLLRAVDGVSFDIHAGETLVVVGESGCGKSTLARACVGLVPTSGDIRVKGVAARDAPNTVRRAAQMVFQDPFAALDPRRTIGQSVMEPLETMCPEVPRQLHRGKAATLFHDLGLEESWLDRFPHELSGGQNQRAALARALIVEPSLLICDEAISALDTTTAAQVLDLLKTEQARRGLGVLFITHDLLAARTIGNRILTLYLGRVVELGAAADVLDAPQHPYTQQLVAASPVADVALMRARPPLHLTGEPPSPFDPAAALRFLPSRLAAGDTRYRPQLLEVVPGHFVEENEGRLSDLE